MSAAPEHMRYPLGRFAHKSTYQYGTRCRIVAIMCSCLPFACPVSSLPTIVLTSITVPISWGKTVRPFDGKRLRSRQVSLRAFASSSCVFSPRISFSICSAGKAGCEPYVMLAGSSVSTSLFPRDSKTSELYLEHIFLDDFLSEALKLALLSVFEQPRLLTMVFFNFVSAVNAAVCLL
jgi:hypothetical protein